MLRASIAFRHGALTVIAVESAQFRTLRAEGLWQLTGIVKPIAVVVCGSGAPYALDMDANDVDLDELRREVPGLDTALTAGAGDGTLLQPDVSAKTLE